MSYHTPDFVLFFVLVLALYSWLPLSMRKALLLLASLFFYAYAGLHDFAVFLIVITTAWLCSYYSAKRSRLLYVGILILSFHLMFWKYIPAVALYLKPSFSSEVLNWLADLSLPVGISFFTLQGIAFLIDLRRGTAEKLGLLDLSLYKSFFPQLIAGPIVRYPELAPQIKNLPQATASDRIVGLLTFAVGFFKKLVIADRLAPFVDKVFAHPERFDRLTLLSAALAFTCQIWADFSGYTDMGIGCARILGFRLPQNFRAPYFACGLSDFWRRWHITLSSWIRDYIYIPLGGNRGGWLRSSLVILITMAISGLWHGAGLPFIAWGIYHGVLLVIEKSFRKSWSQMAFRFEIKPLIAMPLTLISVIFGWILFRSATLAEFLNFISCLISPAGSQSLNSHWELAHLLIATFSLQWIESSVTSESSPLREKWNQMLTRNLDCTQLKAQLTMAALGVISSLSILAAIALSLSRSSPGFIYFRF